MTVAAALILGVLVGVALTCLAHRRPARRPRMTHPGQAPMTSRPPRPDTAPATPPPSGGRPCRCE